MAVLLIWHAFSKFGICSPLWISGFYYVYALDVCSYLQPLAAIHSLSAWFAVAPSNIYIIDRIGGLFIMQLVLASPRAHPGPGRLPGSADCYLIATRCRLMCGSGISRLSLLICKLHSLFISFCFWGSCCGVIVLLYQSFSVHEFGSVALLDRVSSQLSNWPVL